MMHGGYDRCTNMYHISFKHVVQSGTSVISRGTVTYKELIDGVTTTQFVQNILPKLRRDFPFHQSRDDFDIVPGNSFTGLTEFDSTPLAENAMFLTDLIAPDMLRCMTFYVRSKPHIFMSIAASTVCLLCQAFTNMQIRYHCQNPHQHFICDTCFVNCYNAGHTRCSFCRAGLRCLRI